MASICIFTPTYNRGYILDRLYSSLCGQTNNDFHWLIVDDGSTDNTCDLVQRWMQEGQINISYIKTKNQGKPRAINEAVSLCEDELFFVVDSDDYIVQTAIDEIIKYWSAYKNDDKIAGIVALKGYTETRPLGTEMPKGLKTTKIWDLYERHHFKGDISLIHRTDILKHYPYNVADGEKFIAETSVYYAIDDSYDMAVYPHILTICEYLDDGLSKNFVSNAKENPIGYYRHKKDCAARSTTLLGKLRETTLYLVGCKLAGKQNAVKESPSPLIATICSAPAYLLEKTVFK